MNVEIPSPGSSALTGRFSNAMVEGWWSVLDNWDTWGVFVVLSTVNLLVLLSRSRAGRRLRSRLHRWARTISLGDPRGRPDWKPLLGIATVWFGGFTVYNLLSGHYGCLPNGLLSDPLAELNSGRAFWAGNSPFVGVPYCGSTISVPYGMAAVLLDAVGALGGIGGVLVVWGVLALSILPLTWFVAGPDRSYVTVYVATSVLFVPLITSEFSGATNAIVPVTFLLALYLGQRGRVSASAIGGFFATARFPSVFPLLGASGSRVRRRLVAFLAVGGAFAGVTALSYAAWGSGFVQSVFLNQAARRDYSLNLYGILLLHNALPTSVWVEGIQAGLTLALTGAVWALVRSPVRAIAITIVGIALVTPFLAYNFLIWLLPVALVGAGARWWLWAIACVGTINSNAGLGVWAASGVLWPAEAMDVLLTGLLLLLLVGLWKEARLSGDDGIDPSRRAGPAEAVGPSDPVSRIPEGPVHG